MKKKLLSIVALAMAMTMTTSSFAATPRGTGDVDGDGLITANDVLKILKGLADEDPNANVDGYSTIDKSVARGDAEVLYNTILQPKTVSEDLVLYAYSDGLANDVKFRAFDAEDLGSTTGHANEYGLKEVATSVDTTSTTTVKDAIDNLVGQAAVSKIAGINDQIDKIYFHSAVKGDVYLTSENGWAMLCNALRFIVPMDEATAALCNRSGNGTPMAEIEADPVMKERYDALMNVKELIVGSKAVKEGITDEEAAAEHPANLSTADITGTIMPNLYKAIPSGLEDSVIRDTAKEVLKITDTKYSFNVDSEKFGPEVLSEDGVDSSEFIKGIIAVKNYDTVTMADFRNTFGDKLAVGTPNVSVTFEVVVVAGIGEVSTNAPVDTTETTTETTTEATTETTTEATTEPTTEAPAGEETGSVAGMPVTLLPTDSGNLQIPLGTVLTGSEVRVKTVFNFDYAAKGGALLTISYANGANSSDSKAKLRITGDGEIAIDTARDFVIGNLAGNVDHTVEFIIDTTTGKFEVAVDGGAPISHDTYVDANLAKGVNGVKISQGNGTELQRTTTVKEISWVVKGSGEVPTEPTTEAPTETTTETTTEATTEPTTEAPAGEGTGSVAGMPVTLLPTDSGNLQIPLGTVLTGSEVRVKTVLNFDYAAKGGALLTLSYANGANSSDSKAKLRITGDGDIAIDTAKEFIIGNLAGNVDHTVEFIIDTTTGKFEVSIDGGAPISHDTYVDANLIKGINGVKISQGNGTELQRTTTVKEISWVVK